MTYQRMLRKADKRMSVRHDERRSYPFIRYHHPLVTVTYQRMPAKRMGTRHDER